MGVSRRNILIGFAATTIACGTLALGPVRRLFHPIVMRLRGAKTVEDRIGEFTRARQRLTEQFAQAGVTYPPREIVLLGLKQERVLEVYAGPSRDTLRRIARHLILAASGKPGPKLRAGDRQVPEGIYSIESLNPNSRFHVSLRVAYPNPFDRAMADRDGRSRLGGDIMIHGGSASVGCLAMGDDAAEELFLLAAEVGIENVTVILSPMDLRTRMLPLELDVEWRRELYASIRTELATLTTE